MKRPWKAAAIALSVMTACAATAMAADTEYTLVIKEHQFEPKELRIPAGQKVKVWVDNRDASAEEFESYELNREKVVPEGKKAALFIGPLKPGTYKYFGECHPQTAQGVIVAEGA